MHEFIYEKGDPLPERPASLIRGDDSLGHTYDDMACSMFDQQRIVIMAGISIIGSEGYIVTTISIVKPFPYASNPEQGRLVGWSISFGFPGNEPKLVSFDSDSKDHPLPDVFLPTTIVYFAATSDDESLVTSEASQEELKKIVRFATAFVSDDGPPKGIDW